MEKEKETLEDIVEETETNEEDSQERSEEIHNNKDAVQEEMEHENTQEDFDTIKKKLIEKETEALDYYNRLTRLQADFANYKKRVEKEKSDIYLYANEKLALELLNIIDNLERALAVPADENKEDGIYEGVKLINKQLIDALKKHGIEEIDALDKPFDMNLHHAVVKEEADAEENKVIEVFQKGYMIHDKVLRPAMVKVAE